MQQETVRETVLSDTEKNLIKQRNLTQKIIIWSISENIKSTAFDINVKFNQGGYTMKKKILAAILTATLLIAGCSDMANVSAGQDNTMVLVEGWRDYGIYADKDTGVMYLVYQRNGTGCTVMLNADGTPKIWQGEE